MTAPAPDPSSGAPAPVRADARRNRDAVVAAAVRVLSERPDASMREIAEASGVGRTTVYRHFPQREDLLGALYRRVFEEAHAITARRVAEGRAAWAAADGPHGDPVARPTDDAGDGGRRSMADGLEVLALLAIEFADLGDRYRFLAAHREQEHAQLEALAAEYGTEPLASYVTEAQARGQVRDDLTVAWILDVIHGLTTMGAQHVRVGAGTAPELRRMLAATVRSALGPPPPAGS